MMEDLKPHNLVAALIVPGSSVLLLVGRGHPLDAKTRICPTCGGFGKVTLPPFTSTCNTCKGLGRIIKEYCMACRGSGIAEGVKKVNVSIPAGVDSGDTIRVPKAGNAGRRGSQPGFLFIKLKYHPDVCRGSNCGVQFSQINEAYDLNLTAGEEVEIEYEVDGWFYVVKVADFGVARVQTQSTVMTAETGTYRWWIIAQHRAKESCIWCCC